VEIHPHHLRLVAVDFQKILRNVGFERTADAPDGRLLLIVRYQRLNAFLHLLRTHRTTILQLQLQTAGIT
jgi:tRNA1(Val) A37 N6-methylase TrmN6